MRGIGSFPCPQEELVVWVRNHLPGILGSMVQGVLALCPSPTTDTETTGEFFHQEKNKTSQLPVQMDLGVK